MASFNSKKKIGTLLYLITIVLFICTIYFNTKDIKIPYLELSSWVGLASSSFYGIWLGSQKKKEENQS